MDVKEREERLQERIRKLDEMERRVKEHEKNLKAAEQAKKQVLLRLSPNLWDEIAAWAQEDFRSINGQIEYLLTEAVRRRKKSDG